MDKRSLIDILNTDRKGVGVVVYDGDHTLHYFYEDFEDSKGIDRVNEQLKGKRVEVIHKPDNALFFWDWKAQSGSFCAADMYRRYCKAYSITLYSDHLQRYIMERCGRRFKLDYTPAIDGISAIIAIELRKGE